MSDYEVFASFAPDTHTVTATAGPGGSIFPRGMTQVPDGGSLTLTVTANDCYRISNVVVNGQSLGPAWQIPLNNIRQDIAVHATFQPLGPFAIEVNTNDVGTVTSSRGGSIGPDADQIEIGVLCGEGVTLTITPADCYRVKNVRVDGESAGPAPGLIFNNVRKDYVVDVEFELLGPYTITVITNGNGTVGPTQTGGVFGPQAGQFQVQVPCGGGWIFTIMPDGCCRIGSVKVDGVSAVVEEELVFSDVRKNYTVNVTFEPILLTINPGAQGDGSINPQESVTLPLGSSLACTITPGPCQWVSDILVDGASVMDSDTLMSILTTGSSMHRFNPMAMDRSRPSALANGDSIIYPLDGADTLTIDPVTGVFIYTFNQIESDHTIVPIFWELDFTIVTMAENNATIAPLGEIDIPCSQTQLIQVESGGVPVADMYITIDNTMDASLLWSAPDLKMTSSSESDDTVTIEIEIDAVNDPPVALPQEFRLKIADDFALNGYIADDKPLVFFDYFESTTGFYILKNLVISERIELTFVPNSHTVTSWVTWGYDIDTASIPYSIAPTLEQVEDGGSVSLRIEEALAEADCYDFELRITPEGGETVVVPKADLIMGSQADVVNQVNVYTYPINNIRTDHTAELVYTRTTITIDIQTNDGGMVGPTQDGGTIGPEAGEFQLDLPCNDAPQLVEITPLGNNVIGDVKLNGDSLLDLSGSQNPFLCNISITYCHENPP